MKIKDVPEYVLNPAYKMTHVLVAEVDKDLFQYRMCFTTKGASTRRFNLASKRYPNIHFAVASVEDIKKGTYE